MKKYTVKLSELCFYFFFGLLLCAKGIGLYDGQTGFKIFLIAAFAAWMGKMLMTQYSVREVLLYASLILLGGAIYLTSREKGVLMVIMLLCGLKNMNLEKVFRVGAVIWSLSFGSLFLLTSLHILDSPFKVHDRLGLGRVIRWSLGYSHPNVLHISYLVMVCFLVYLLRKKLYIWGICLLEIGNLYVYMYSLSTTGFLATTFCLVLVMYWNIRKGFCRLEQVLIQFCLPVCLFLSFGAPLLLTGRAFDIVNKLLNTRLELSKWFLENLPVQLLGRNTTTSVTAVRTMDSSYVFALITYGIIFFAFIIWEYARIIYQKTRNQDGIALCVILSCLIAGLTEPFMFNTSFKNISLLFIGAELFQTGHKKTMYTVRVLTDREFAVYLPNIALTVREVWNAARKHRTSLVIISVMSALIIGSMVFHNASEPERYLLPRKAFEYTDDLEEAYYLTSEDNVQQEGDVILGFESPQTEMVAFKGNIWQLERFRNTVNGGLLTGILVFVTGSLILFVKARGINGVQRNEG